MAARRLCRGLTGILLAILLTITGPGTGMAKTFLVNSGHDKNDLEPGNGLCVAAIVVVIPAVLVYCTLRAAIEEANALPGEDTIVLGSGTYSLTLAGRGEDQAGAGDLDITDSVRIIGTGADTTYINAGSLDRIFDIHGTATRVILGNLSLMGGNPASAGGGAIRNQGSLFMDHVTIRANRAGQGGAIQNLTGGTIRISASTLMENSSATGGAIHNHGAAALINTTLAQNQATDPGGGVYNTGTCDLTHCTIADNQGLSGGGLVNEATLTLTNSLLADNRPDNCQLHAPLASRGGNLDTGHTCGLGSMDSSGRAAWLGPLAQNGGPTLTMALSPASPAVDGGVSLASVTTDQRGEPRPTRQGPDSGAYELAELALPPCLLPLLKN